MGFYEDDRIRRKNRAYNFPTPEINFEARKVLREINTSNKARALYFLGLRMEQARDDHRVSVLRTAIQIVEKEIR